MSGYSQDQCCHPGCTKLQVESSSNYNYTGLPGYRKWCNRHYEERRAANAGTSRNGYIRKIHPSRQHQKTYCENTDGRLGFKCTTTIVTLPGDWNGMLDVDHKDGNPSNNNPENLQTLCKCCHAYKGKVNGDQYTPGRKALGIS